MIGGSDVGQDSRAHPVIEALQARVEGSVDEGIRLALIIEGGGMRGVVCGGIVAALEHMGFTPAFHDVIGSSAGAIAGAYFVAGQAAFGTRIFYEEINNRQFVSKRRLLIGKPVVSVDFLLDDVCRRTKLLDLKAVLDASSRLVCIASNIDREHSVALDRFEGQEGLFAALKASARIPAVAGPPVIIDGDRHLDAGVHENIPYATALARGATHVVVLMTLPEGKEPAALELSENSLLCLG
jgi:predicted patatin/cPLA2 family phospholipase